MEDSCTLVLKTRDGIYVSVSSGNVALCILKSGGPYLCRGRRDFVKDYADQSMCNLIFRNEIVKEIKHYLELYIKPIHLIHIAMIYV